MNKMYLDVIQQRRPAINYVSPAICDAIFSSTSFPVLVLDALPSDVSLTGLRFIFGGGSFRLAWDSYPGALCYTIYKVNDATDPFGEYTIIAECITDTFFDLTTDPDFEPDEKVCYLVSIITPLGEQFISPPICSNPDPEEPPDPPPVGGCIENDTPLPDGETGSAYSVTFTPVGPAAGPQWTITAGELPDGLTLDINSGVLSGTPTAAGSYTFTVRLTKDGGGFCEQEYDLTVAPVFVWGLAEILTTGSGGVSSFTPSEAPGNVVAIATDNAGGADPATGAINFGTFDWNSDETLDCNVHIEVVTNNTNPAQCAWVIQITILSEDGMSSEVLVDVSSSPDGYGVFDIPFTLPVRVTTRPVQMAATLIASAVTPITATLDAEFTVV